VSAPAIDQERFTIFDVLDGAVDAVLGGSGGFFHIPPGGYLNCTYLTKKKCYRVTVDVTAGHPLDDAAPDFVKRVSERLAAL
jgi:hypothetical protein